jgi:2-polyprenyl-3-methyl-5-hydroxy-6-metoxy-1,4-benzoquinol methylase
LVRKRRPDAEVWAVEADAQSAAIARTRAHWVLEGAFPRDTAADLVGEKFDCILFNEVLEYMVSPTEAVDAARALSAPAGVVVASIPNVRHWSVIWPLLRHGSFEYEKVGGR